ncbi:hypothetical protein [Sediminitomix flava]|uniref:Uncharacterized protein n=1 Tax=Sediminitomix flava TaxID=379075 RepID=A0A315ZZL7_SEDFL|nr:hypothetical protein [Sediminitomix flava]PWJ42817.1 hypothetical protein BC781_102363 [Sediminitomix flava]
MNRFYFILGVFLCFACVKGTKAQNMNSPIFKRIQNWTFPLDKEALENGEVVGYIEFLDKNYESFENHNDDSKDFLEHVKALDTESDFDKKDEDYYILGTKVVYLVDAPIDYFNKDRLTNLDYFQSTMPGYKLQDLNNNTFAIQGGVMEPDFKFKVAYVDVENDLERKGNDLKNVFRTYKRDQIMPSSFTWQENFDYGRVMFHKTSEMSKVLTVYYPYEGNRTLVECYTLNYLYNVPPALMGGPSMLIDDLKSGILSYVQSCRKIANQAI